MESMDMVMGINVDENLDNWLLRTCGWIIHHQFVIKKGKQLKSSHVFELYNFGNLICELFYFFG
jgi:hypothetical protein